MNIDIQYKPSARRLEGIEISMAIQHAHGGGNTQGSQLSTYKGQVSLQELYLAINYIFNKYPLLRCSIRQEAEDLYFVENVALDEISLVEISCENEQKKKKLFEAEINTPIDSSHSLWRLCLLKWTDQDVFSLILTCHHAIIDGTGYYEILNDLLNFIDGNIERTDTLVSYQDHITVLPPPINKFLLPPKEPAGVNSTAIVKHDLVTDLADRYTKVIQEKISGCLYSILNEKCASDKISVNSLLGIVFMKAMVAHDAAFNPLSFKTAVSLRERAASRDDYHFNLGCYVGVCAVAIDVQTDDILAAARKYEKTLLAEVFKQTLRVDSRTSSQISQGVLQQIAVPAFTGCAGMSNVGKVKVDQDFQKFKMIEYYASNNRNLGATSLVLTVSEFNNGYDLIFTYVKPLITAEHVNRTIKTMLSYIDEYLEDSATCQ